MKEFINLTSVDVRGKETVISININTINSIEPIKESGSQNTLIYLNNRIIRVKELYSSIMNLIAQQIDS